MFKLLRLLLLHILFSVVADACSTLSDGKVFGPADILFLLDTTGATDPQWAQTCGFVAAVFGNLSTPAHKSVRLGIIVFDSQAQYLLQLQSGQDPSRLHSTMLTLPRHKGAHGRRTFFALEKAGKVLRPPVKRVAVLLTVGPSEHKLRTVAAARDLKDNQGIVLYTVGLGTARDGAGLEELWNVASSPHHAFLAEYDPVKSPEGVWSSEDFLAEYDPEQRPETTSLLSQIPAPLTEALCSSIIGTNVTDVAGTLPHTVDYILMHPMVTSITVVTILAIIACATTWAYEDEKLKRIEKQLRLNAIQPVKIRVRQQKVALSSSSSQESIGGGDESADVQELRAAILARKGERLENALKAVQRHSRCPPEVTPEASRCPPEVIWQAEELLETLKDAMQLVKVENALRLAMVNWDMDAVTQELAKAKELDAPSSLIHEAEQHLAVFIDGERCLKNAIQQRDVEALRMVIDETRACEGLKELQLQAKQLQRELERECWHQEVRTAIQNLTYPRLQALVRRAADLDLQHDPVYAEAEGILSQLKRYSVDVGWDPGSIAGPWGTTNWHLNPVVEILVMDKSKERCPAFLALEDLGGSTGAFGQKPYGFHVVKNPRDVPHTCPCMIPGGKVVADAPYQSDGTATAEVGMETGQRVFAVPSLNDPVRRGSKARLDILSPLDLSCRLVPSNTWAFQTTFNWAWSVKDKTAGGPRGCNSWPLNPQLRVYLDAPGPTCVLAVLKLPQEGRLVDTFSLHAAKNRKSMSHNVHAGLIPRNYTVFVQPPDPYENHYKDNFTRQVSICFEVSEDDLIVDPKAKNAPPFYLVPSLRRANEESTFELHVFATGKLRCERVSAQKGKSTSRSGKEKLCTRQSIFDK